MSLLLLEALGALVLLVFIVWWTMFSGRKNGELTPDLKDDNGAISDVSASRDAKTAQIGPTNPKKP